MKAGAKQKTVSVHVQSGGKLLPLSPWGGKGIIDSDLFEGEVYFLHRPPDNRMVLTAQQAALLEVVPGAMFDLQLQGRFKKEPRGDLVIAGELRDHPMKLGLVARALAKAMLAFGQVLASQRGIKINYSFGDANTYANITIPLLIADRIVVSNEKQALPILTKEWKGTWRAQGNEHVPIERNDVKLNTQEYVTFFFSTPSADLIGWRAVNIPGVGSLDLTTFWADQAAHLVSYSSDGTSFGQHGSRDIVFDLQFKSVVCEGEELLPDPDSPHLSREKSSATIVPEVVNETVMVLPEDAAVVQPDLGAERDSDKRPTIVALLESDDNEGNTAVVVEEELDDERELNLNDNTFSRCSTPGTSIFLSLENGDNANDIPPWTESSVLGSISIPWYLQHKDGNIWWCIAEGERHIWRHSSQLEDLCVRINSATKQPDIYLGPQQSVPDLERGRRLAVQALNDAKHVRGLLEEFVRVTVTLASLLGKDESSSSHLEVAIVEAEGRLAVHQLCCEEHTSCLWWSLERYDAHGHRKRCKILVDLSEARLASAIVPDLGEALPALLLDTASRRHVLLLRDEAQRQGLQLVISGAIERAVVNIGRGHRPRPWPACCCSRRQASKPPQPSNLTTTARVGAATWKDPLARWPQARIVLNEADVYLEPMGPPTDALAFSAALLRDAIAAQNGPPEQIQALTIRTSGLKMLRLDRLAPQGLWSFWVNVFHLLLVHSRLLVGFPVRLTQIIGFFNRCSYLVAGHVLSLAEIEHCTLRHGMSKPKIKFADSFVKIWQRTETDFEQRPAMAAPANPAACFRCRSDWRLNLVLNAGNVSCADYFPVLESLDEHTFDRLLFQAAHRTLKACGNVRGNVVELPYCLRRYADDAPSGNIPSEPSERRWGRALELQDLQKIRFSNAYSWVMRERLDIFDASGLPFAPSDAANVLLASV